MKSQVAPVGLRARKRAETATTITRAAIALVEKDGYEAVTVEAICAAAQVSPGTFYNYFGTKEGVFLGQPPWPSDEAVAAFVSGDGNVVVDLIDMVETAINSADGDLFRAMGGIVMRTPALAGQQMARLGEMERRLLELVLRRYETQGLTRATPEALRDEARTVVVLGTTVHRLTTGIRGSATPPAGRDALLARIALIHGLTAPPTPDPRSP